MANHPSLTSNSKELKYITAILILREGRKKEREGRRRGRKGEKGERAKGERRDRSELMKLSPSPPFLSRFLPSHLQLYFIPLTNGYQRHQTFI